MQRRTFRPQQPKALPATGAASSSCSTFPFPDKGQEELDSKTGRGPGELDRQSSECATISTAYDIERDQEQNRVSWQPGPTEITIFEVHLWMQMKLAIEPLLVNVTNFAMSQKLAAILQLTVRRMAFRSEDERGLDTKSWGLAAGIVDQTPTGRLFGVPLDHGFTLGKGFLRDNLRPGRECHINDNHLDCYP